jgi:predicted HTH transcriptional regulator
MGELVQRILQGENLHQDFKFRIDDQQKIARTLAAFANTDGGSILIGVKDNGKIVGCNPEEELYMIEGAASVFCQPALEFRTQLWQEDLKLVLEIAVSKSENPVYRSRDEQGKWRYFTRIGDQTVQVNKILEGVWREKKKSHAKPEKWGIEESSLLKIIAEEQPISLSKLYRKSAMSLKTVDRLLILLICWDLVNYNWDHNGMTYILKP